MWNSAPKAFGPRRHLTPGETGDPLQVSKLNSTVAKYHITLLISSPDICFWPHSRENTGPEHHVLFCHALGKMWSTGLFSHNQLTAFSWCLSLSCMGLITNMNTSNSPYTAFFIWLNLPIIFSFLLLSQEVSILFFILLEIIHIFTFTYFG